MAMRAPVHGSGTVEPKECGRPGVLCNRTNVKVNDPRKTKIKRETIFTISLVECTN